MEMKLIRALRFFIEFDAESRQSHVFNAPVTDADGKEIEPGTTGKLPADVAQKRVDVGDAEFVEDAAEQPATPRRRTGARAGKAAAAKPTKGARPTKGAKALPAAYEATYVPVGQYEITGPDGFSELIRGKAKAEARLLELNSQERTAEGSGARGAASDDAPPVD